MQLLRYFTHDTTLGFELQQITASSRLIPKYYCNKNIFAAFCPQIRVAEGGEDAIRQEEASVDTDP